MSNPLGDLSPCVVDYDGATVVFNKTHGGVFFRYQEFNRGIKEDQKGSETDVDEVSTGAMCELEVPLTRTQLSDLNYLFGNSSQAGSYLKVSNPVGEAKFAGAVALIVKPIVNGVVSVTTTEWLTIHRASPSINMELAYNNEGQRVVKAIFKCFPDDASGQVGEFWRAGPTS